MSSGSACWILWLTPMDWLALSIGRSGSQPLEYSLMQKPNFYINRNLRSIYPNGYIDLGMAHGLASILKFLVNCLSIPLTEVHPVR